MTTYRLPEVLGGGEVEPCADEPDYPKVGFDLQGVSGILWLDRVDLIEVVPPLPYAPPVGSFVYAGSLVLQRRDDAGIDWWEYQDRCWLTWAQVCALGTPVRLIPEPVVEPVALPWTSEASLGRRVYVTRLGGGPIVGIEYTDGSGSTNCHVNAGEMARALMAADAAERAS